MKKTKITILLLVLTLSLVLTACDKKKDEGKAEAEKYKDAYAMVGGVEIKKDEFNKLFTVWEESYGEEFMQGSEQGRTMRSLLRERLLKDCILGLCYENYFVEKNMGLKEEDLNEKLKQYKVGLEKSGDKGELFQKKGITDEILKGELKRNYYSLKFIQELEAEYRPKFEMTDDEFYASKLTVRVRQILVDEEKLAEEIREKLVKGEDFEKLMEKHTKDEASKSRRGELGTLKYEDMPVEFSSVVFHMNKGEISKPIKTSFGYHIVELLDYETVKNQDDEELLDKAALAGLKEELYQRYLSEKIYERQRELIEGAEVKIFGGLDVEE